MKVFAILIDDNYQDETDLGGVFATKEKAIDNINEWTEGKAIVDMEDTMDGTPYRFSHEGRLFTILEEPVQ